jgi:hypothetical protein
MCVRLMLLTPSPLFLTMIPVNFLGVSTVVSSLPLALD